MNKHTPGPWEYFDAKDLSGDTTISIRGNCEFIATMDTVSINGSPFGLPENGRANARLIAAAPDLLAALEESERVIRWAAQEAAGRVDKEKVGGWLYHADQARAAIRKAKGD